MGLASKHLLILKCYLKHLQWIAGDAYQQFTICFSPAVIAFQLDITDTGMWIVIGNSYSPAGTLFGVLLCLL